MSAATGADLREEIRAGDGNRNRMTSLEGSACGSPELRLRSSRRIFAIR
jgi:hypothetical protein